MLAEVRRPFNAGDPNRDKVIDSYRDLRHGRSKPWLPDGIEVQKADIYFQDPLPEFVINRIKQRLGANDIEITIRVPGDAGPTLQRQAENLESGLRGAKDELDPFGLVDGRMREHQAADGTSFLELELKPSFVPPGRGSQEGKEYDQTRDLARRNYGLGVCAVAPDPRSLYWVDARGAMKIVCKVTNVPLVDVKNNWTAEGFRLDYVSDGDKPGAVEKRYIQWGETPPAPTAAEWGKRIRLVVIADNDYIYHCCYPTVLGPGDQTQDDANATPALILLGKYRNPFKRPPFFMAGARTTSDPNPAYHHLPLALELLRVAPYVNQWRTIRMLNGTLQALKPIHAQPSRPMSENENAAPKHIVDLWKPGFLEYDGIFKEIPSPMVPDFDKFDTTLSALYNSYNQSISGALLNGAVGKSTPAWSLMQITEEQVGLLEEALDSRAVAWREALISTVEAVYDRHAADGPVYVRASAINRKKPEAGRTDTEISLTRDDLRLLIDKKVRLEVSIQAMTQSQRAADTEYWRRLHMEGTISDETYENEIGLTDRIAEQARKDRESVMKPMKERAQATANAIATAQLARFLGPDIAAIVLGTAPPIAPPGEDAGEVEGEGGNVLDDLKMPGQGMSDKMPDIRDRVRTNGNRPETMATGRA